MDETASNVKRPMRHQSFFALIALIPRKTPSIQLTSSPTPLSLPMQSLQVFIYVNSPPSGGMVEISPPTGTALLTTFTLNSPGWGDVEADLPIQYAYYLSIGTEGLTPTSMLVQPLGNSSTCTVRPPQRYPSSSFLGSSASSFSKTHFHVRSLLLLKALGMCTCAADAASGRHGHDAGGQGVRLARGLHQHGGPR